MIDEAAQDGLNEFEQEEQLQDAIEIMAQRLDGMGVAEPGFVHVAITRSKYNWQVFLPRITQR